jgi:1,4-alpha-glucan branching enzyme
MTSVRPNGQIEFRFFRAGAKDVAVAGDFTDWSQNPIAMRHEGNGWFTARVALQPGEYRFRYLADGQWFTDYASHGVELKKQTWNSVLLVHESAIGSAQRYEERALAA